MSENKVWAFRIRHILKAIDEIQGFVAGMSYDDFMADPKTLRAVERNIEIIGEAAGKIPEDVKSRYPDIPWSGMRGMRNAVAHGYDQIEYESVWDVVVGRLPELKKMLESVSLPKGEGDW
jgi:uncharacterized protein with HEPN domain